MGRALPFGHCGRIGAEGRHEQRRCLQRDECGAGKGSDTANVFGGNDTQQGHDRPQRNFIFIPPRLQREIDAGAVERPVIGNQKIPLHPDDDAKAEEQRDVGAEQSAAKRECNADQSQPEYYSRHEQRAHDLAERRAKLSNVAGKDCVGAEQAERKDNKESRGDHGVGTQGPTPVVHRMRLRAVDIERDSDVVDVLP